MSSEARIDQSKAMRYTGGETQKSVTQIYMSVDCAGRGQAPQPELEHHWPEKDKNGDLLLLSYLPEGEQKNYKKLPKKSNVCHCFS